jgi:hypothetical protein
MPKGTAFKEVVQDSGSFFKDVYLVYKDLVPQIPPRNPHFQGSFATLLFLES